MDKIKGTDNEIILSFADGEEVKLPSASGRWKEIVNQSNITIAGNGNHVVLAFDAEQDAETLLLHKGFEILIVGDENRLNIGRKFGVGYLPDWGMLGLRLNIGSPLDAWTAPDASRAANRCTMDIGEHVMVAGAKFYLQEDESTMKIGSDTMFSWGIDVWNSDAHTLMDSNGVPYNYPTKCLEIGRHVWVGKDVKIGKNVKIADGCVIGWNSLVTKSFEQPDCIIAGCPAKVVKENIRWDSRCLNSYLQYIGQSCPTK